MPENDEQDISVGALAPVETERERFERERLSRRQALKRFGMISAMATFALFSVDDLARMVGKAMQQRAADNKVVEQVAKEFQQAGIAMAAGGASGSCQQNALNKQIGVDACNAGYSNCTLSPTVCQLNKDNCLTGVRTKYCNNCSTYGCTCGSGCP